MPDYELHAFIAKFVPLLRRNMNRHCDIICLALFRWDSEISSTAQSLAAEFSKSNRVFFIEHPFSFKDYWQLRDTKAIQLRKKALLKRNEPIAGKLAPGNWS